MPEFTDDPTKYKIRRMDCMDCHSRPAHKIHTPNDAVDLALMTNRLDASIPWVKAKVVTALTQPYATTAEAEQGIAKSLHQAYPDPARAGLIIEEAQRIYRANFFPEVKTDWRTHPDFVGHKNWNGCFRCHDGKHVAAGGKMSIKASDCRSHLILAQGDPEGMKQISAQGDDFITSTRRIRIFPAPIVTPAAFRNSSVAVNAQLPMSNSEEKNSLNTACPRFLFSFPSEED